MMKSYLAEFLGTTILLAIVTGSGIMGESLASGNNAVALLGNSIATGAGLYVLISLLGPISGAHFNPVVSLMFWRLKQLDLNKMLGYWLCQFTGAIAGVGLTHFMFSLPIIQESTKVRAGIGIWASEFISTLVLLLVIRMGDQTIKERVPMLVALTVTAGYWFTSSTFFANPAVAFARSFTDTFVGIAPISLGGFVAAEVMASMALLTILLFIKQRS